jgi:ribosomal protein S18 acetylase RimI-like enzyme
VERSATSRRYVRAVTAFTVEIAGEDEPDAIGRLLHDFNIEYEEVTPGPEALAKRITELIGAGETVVLVARPGPAGLAVLRFRPSIWTPGLECYLAELYVAPERRGQGIGTAILEAVLRIARERGADYIDLNTSEDDEAARHLYEKFGFVNRERGDGPLAYYYEREL